MDRAAPRLPAVHASVDNAITRIFPNLSPKGPKTSCITPYARAKAEIAWAAWPMVTPKSACNDGSSESHTLIDAMLAKQHVLRSDNILADKSALPQRSVHT